MNKTIYKPVEVERIKVDYKSSDVVFPMDRLTFIANCFSPIDRLPQKYIINKGATVLFWEDGSKTIVKRCKNDKYDKRLGFLTAYFQKNSGLSKNKANKYLADLEEME